MSVQYYGAESYTSIGATEAHQSQYDASDWQQRTEQIRIGKIVSNRARIITCISACLSPITCPIWCVEGTMLSCSALIRKLLAPDGTDFSKGCYSCYFFCGGCFCELCRWQFACCYPKPEPALNYKEKEECSPCTRLFCSVFYPCHACPSPFYDWLGALPLGLGNKRSQHSPWMEPHAYCLPGPEREVMRHTILTKAQKAQNIKNQQEETRKAEARKKKAEEAQTRKAQQQREEEARKKAAEEARIRDVERRRQEAQRRREEEQEAQAAWERLEREDPVQASIYRQEALLARNNELLREQNALLRQQAAARSAQPSG